MWRTTVTLKMGKKHSTTQTLRKVHLQEQQRTCLKRQWPDMPRTTCLSWGWGSLPVFQYPSLLSQVFLKDPYYQKMVRDRKMSGGSFFGSAGGFLGLCLGLSAMSVVEIFYHVFLFIIAICRGREMSETHYKNEKWRLLFTILLSIVTCSLWVSVIVIENTTIRICQYPQIFCVVMYSWTCVVASN